MMYVINHIRLLQAFIKECNAKQYSILTKCGVSESFCLSQHSVMKQQVYHNSIQFTNELIIRKMEATLINNMQLPILITSKH